MNLLRVKVWCFLKAASELSSRTTLLAADRVVAQEVWVVLELFLEL